MGDWFDDNGRSGAVVNVPDVLNAGALDAVVRVVDLGALVSIGLTSDGGALHITVTSDGRWKREYFRDSDGIVPWLGGAELALNDPRGAPASPAPRSRPRRRQSGA